MLGKATCSACVVLLSPDSGDMVKARAAIRTRYGPHPAVTKEAVIRVCSLLGASHPPALLQLALDVSASPAVPDLHFGKAKSCLLLKEVCDIHITVSARLLGVSHEIDRKSLLKYLSPHLALAGIQLRMGCKQLGHVFIAPVGVAASSRAAELRTERRASWDCGANRLTFEEEPRLLGELSASFGKSTLSYERGEWNLRDEIAKVPEAIWVRRLLRIASCRRIKGWRGYFNDIGKIAFPVSNAVVPDLFLDVDQSLAKIVVMAFYQVEQAAAATDSNRRPGPIMTSLGITSLTASTKCRQTILNHLGICPSYDRSRLSRAAFAADEMSHPDFERRGHFVLIPDSSVCIASLDNLNARSKHGICAVGFDGSSGFDGLALQAVGHGGPPVNDTSPSEPALPDMENLETLSHPVRNLFRH